MYKYIFSSHLNPLKCMYSCSYPQSARDEANMCVCIYIYIYFTQVFIVLSREH